MSFAKTGETGEGGSKAEGNEEFCFDMLSMRCLLYAKLKKSEQAIESQSQ